MESSPDFLFDEFATVGELFVSDNGLLGVFCLCHSLRMSVAKFCEVIIDV